MNKRIKKKQIKMENKRLCKRYPFLIPRNVWTGKSIWSKRCNIRNNRWYIQPYSHIELDAMPKGWRKAFGKQMCEEIREVLIKGNYLNNYRIIQIKEKFGSLRWYDGSIPQSIYKETRDIINKYEKISAHTCICCGRPATKLSVGWISPYCDKCAEKFSNKVGMKFEDIKGDK